MDLKKLKTGTIGKFAAVLLLGTAQITGTCNFTGGTTNFVAYAQDPVEKKVLTQEDVKALIEDQNVFADGVFKIPEEFTEVGDNAFVFYDCSKNLTEINIPDGVTKIGNNAFWGCKGLKQINIPDSVKEIGSGAFWDCKGLTQVAIYSNCIQIRSVAFCACENLERITIYSSVAQIGASTFSGCSNLKLAEFMGERITFRVNCFNKCRNLNSASFPNAKIVRGIGHAFRNSDKAKFLLPHTCTIE